MSRNNIFQNNIMIVGHSLPKKFAFIGLFALVLGVGWGNAASWNKGDLFVAVNGGGFRVYRKDFPLILYIVMAVHSIMTSQCCSQEAILMVLST